MIFRRQDLPNCRRTGWPWFASAVALWIIHCLLIPFSLQTAEARQVDMFAIWRGVSRFLVATWLMRWFWSRFPRTVPFLARSIFVCALLVVCADAASITAAEMAQAFWGFDLVELKWFRGLITVWPVAMVFSLIIYLCAKTEQARESCWSILLAITSYLHSRTAFGGRLRNITSMCIVLAWLGGVIFISTRHEVWRDEVRALSIATTPASICQLPMALQNEGHPVLWYLLLRMAYAVLHQGVVLKVVSVSVGLGGVLLFWLYAPFFMWQKILFLGGVFPLYEYSVISRNYGISMFLCFLFATMYARHDRNILFLGVVLAALANTNLHSTVLTGLLAAYLFYDELILRHHLLTPNRIAALSATFGFVVLGIFCAVCVIMPSEDCLVGTASALSPERVFWALNENLIHPGFHFDQLIPFRAVWARDVLIWLMVAGLLIVPPAALALLTGTVSLGVIFSVVYDGTLRHQGLLLMYLVTLYWIAIYAHQEPTGTKTRPRPPLSTQLTFASFFSWDPALHSKSTSGLQFIPAWFNRLRGYLHGTAVYVAFPALLCLNMATAFTAIRLDLTRDYSSSKSLAAFLESHSELKHAILLGEPDYLLESLPYYAANRIYLPREGRYSNTVSFTTNNRARLSLGELLSTAQQIISIDGKPVLIVIGHPEFLDANERTSTEIRFSFNKLFNWSPEDLAKFRAKTIKLAEFRKAITDENYAVYLLH